VDDLVQQIRGGGILGIDGIMDRADGVDRRLDARGDQIHPVSGVLLASREPRQAGGCRNRVGPAVRDRVKGSQPLGGSTGVLDKMLEPGAVETITIQTPWKAGMSGNSWFFSHANGGVKARKVAKFEEPKSAAAPATAKKK